MIGRLSLEASGFAGFVTFGDLREFWLDKLPKTGGAYAVLRESPQPPTFVATSSAGRFKGNGPAVSIGTLEAKWVAGAAVVYFGKADNLQRRLKQYARFGAGDPVGLGAVSLVAVVPRGIARLEAGGRSFV
jgi:hypothetical protein